MISAPAHPPHSAPIAYPPARRADQIDQYHGVAIPDPYRWLEDETTGERARWIEQQNRLTSDYLERTGLRPILRARFLELLDYERIYDLTSKGPYRFFKKNTGLQSQLVLYVQRGTGAPEVLVDPRTLAADGTVRVTLTVPSRDSRYLAYGLSYGGSDWEEIRVKDLVTWQDLDDRVRWVKASQIAWYGNGFYYSRYPPPSDVGRPRSGRNQNHQVCYHRVGTSSEADTLVYEDRAHPLRLHLVESTEDEQFVILSAIDRGAGQGGNALMLLDAERLSAPPRPLVSSFEAEFRVVDNEGSRLLVLTNRQAPNWRLVQIDPADPAERHWTDIIPQTEHRLESVVPAGDQLLASYRCEASHQLHAFDRTGRRLHQIPLPGTGSVQVFRGQRQDREALWVFTGFTQPPATYRYSLVDRHTAIVQEPKLRFNPSDYQTRQVFYPSRDGTLIPMFLVHKKSLTLDGSHPLLLHCYGGNGASVGPVFDPFVIALLERGFVYAVASLRGGGEYGEEWHQAGWRENKQNVFDDCIAAAAWLYAQGYSSADRSVLIGGSNGGLLVGAVMVQRPDLFRVALPDVGIMDMLRFHHFTMGWAWIAEYGSPDDPMMFPALLAYSPLHNVKEGVTYPATLATTSVHDERVVPAHSFKFVATLQRKGAPTRPYLVRIDRDSGHGAVSLPKMIEERADQYAFLLAQMPEPAGSGRTRQRSFATRPGYLRGTR